MDGLESLGSRQWCRLDVKSIAAMFLCVTCNCVYASSWQVLSKQAAVEAGLQVIPGVQLATTEAEAIAIGEREGDCHW